MKGAVSLPARGVNTGGFTNVPQNPTDRFLSRVEKVKQTGPDKWVACCPAHDDKNPSLGVRECSDGTVLVKCWAGCSAADIAAAVGLELRDLFPTRTSPCRQHHDGLDAETRRQCRKILQEEAYLIRFARAARASGQELSLEDVERVLLADDRARKAREALGYE